MINYYEIEVKGKNVYRFFNKVISNKINVFDVKYKKDRIIFKVSYEDYLKIKKIRTIYEINIIEIQGTKKIKKMVKFYKIYLIFFVISLILVFIYSKMILKINVNTDNQELKSIVLKELENNNITLFSFSKSYKSLRRITNNIKENNKEIIEFIEINKNGVCYTVDLIEKVRKDNNDNFITNDIVASKNGLIMDMYVTRGEILKNKGDYVSVGDVIVSGNITKNEEVKNKVAAEAKVYAETWYKVKVNYPKMVKVQKNETGNTSFKLKILNKNITLLKFNNKKIKEEKTINIFKNSLFKFYIDIKFNENLIYKTYDDSKVIDLAIKKARDNLLKTLESDERILLEKTLKIDKDNDKIYVEVFFKVYEDIATKKEIKEIEKEILE